MSLNSPIEITHESYLNIYLAPFVHYEECCGVPTGLDPLHDLLVVLPRHVDAVDLDDDVLSLQASGSSRRVFIDFSCKRNFFFFFGETCWLVVIGIADLYLDFG